ncbi:hypothetical protein L7F22_046743 [Adiantum nelumboides]|nr:hypothetical protein [Adiantum nelumboides]
MHILTNRNIGDMESAARLPLCSHLLQHTLRGVCVESEWMYCVFWRILLRNFPPPKWELGGYLERSKANKRNWILAWEDGFCDFTRSAAADDAVPRFFVDASNKKSEEQAASRRLHPELFFKMSHEIYNYGEGLNLTIYEQAVNLLAQTIVVVAVREGLVQLGSTRQVLEDVNFVMLLQRKFNSLQQAYDDPVQQQPPNLTAAALVQTYTMLPPADQILRRVLKRVGRPVDDAELEPGFTRTLERRLTWSSCGSVRPGFHRLDLPLIDNSYSVSSFNTLQENEQHISLPLAHDVTAADHLSLSNINATQLPSAAATAAPTVSTSQCSGVITSVGYQNPSCSLGINLSLRQGDLTTSANSVSTNPAAQQCISNGATAVQYAARRSVLPCISNVQALLSHQLITRPSTNSPAPATLMHQQQHINMVHDNLSASLPSPSSPVSSVISVRPVATGSFSASTASTSPQQLDEGAAASKSADLQPITFLTTTSGQQHPSTTTTSTCSPARPARLLQQHRELHEDGLVDARKFTAVLTIVESGPEAAHDCSPHQQTAAHSSDISSSR